MQKTILLSPCDQTIYTGMPRGILTIEYNNEILLGKMRLYNLSINPMQSKIGAYINGRVYKADLQPIEKNLYSFKITNVHIKFDELYFALVENGKFLLCGGNYSDSIVNIKDYFTLQEKQVKQPLNETFINNKQETAFQNFNDEQPVSNIEQNIEPLQKNDTKAPSYDEIAQKDMEDFFMQKEMIDKLRNMEYQNESNEFDEALYKKEMAQNKNYEMINEDNPIQDRTQQQIRDPSLHNNQTPQQDQTQQQDQIRDPSQDQQKIQEHKTSAIPFLDNINDQIQELLDNYPTDEQLENIVPDARFVKIEDNETDSYYVLGVIYQNDKIKYIAYGVPGTFNSDPPAELQDKSQWLPLDIEDPLSDGYYLIYQDADTGNLVDLVLK